MYNDKKYLKDVLLRPDIKSEQQASGKIRTLANEALGFLNIREHFWRQQKPMYARKFGLNFNDNVIENIKIIYTLQLFNANPTQQMLILKLSTIII